jgi:hypothetical protein
VTFKVENNRIYDLTAGIRMSCIPHTARAELDRGEVRPLS